MAEEVMVRPSVVILCDGLVEKTWSIGGEMIDFGWLGHIAFTWEFLVAVMSIILIDLVLAGDNAVVI
ncbi:MAG: hypothetical protein AABZ40_05450, partial [Thermodesulfobacteriota bacterium]